MISNIPAGANTPDAPWNQSEPDEKDFEVTCSQSLSKTATVTTRNYIPGNCGVDCEKDGEGGYYKSFYEDAPDTTGTNWAEEWHENDHYTPIQLIELFRQCLINMQEYGLVFKTPAQDSHLIEECDGWIEDDVDYMHD